VQKGFTPRQVDRQRDVMRQCAGELVDNFDGDEIDFVESFSVKFPVVSICRILGVPEEDIPLFQDAATILHLMGAVPLAPGFPRIEEGLGVLHDYVSRLVCERRRQPKNDFISALIEAEQSEGKLTEEELVWNIVNLLFAAQDTTRFQLAGVVRAAVEEPGGTWERLAADPSLVGAVLSEGYRFYPAVQWSSRQPLDEIEYNGFRFAKGQWMFLNNLAASRDPQAFPDPDRYDIARAQRFAVPFGRGLHHCVGQLLAKIGMEEALLILSRRLADPRVVGDVYCVSPTAMVGGPEHLPIGFRERA
jgi:cytochrome P450